jgi:hypothetical protein
VEFTKRCALVVFIATAAAVVSPANVDLVVVLVNGLPVPLMVTTRPIAAGAEVSMSYGKAYWTAWACLKRAAQAREAGNHTSAGLNHC